jgi:endo-1,4-beta-xylanase
MRLQSISLTFVLWILFLDSNGQTLRNVSAFPVGVSVSVKLISNDIKYRTLVAKEFNSITPENAMKMSELHPRQDEYDFRAADSLVAFAKRNHMRVHGHTLVWHQSLPNWVSAFKGDSAAWEGMMKEHIQSVVSHFKSKVSGWDVVNEAFADDGSFRITPWLDHLGPGYIERAFLYAHETDSGAKLFYNDYGTEYHPEKLAAIIKLVNALKGKGIPINGIGLQTHIDINVSPAAILKSVKAAKSTGLLVHISELDVSIAPLRPVTILTPDTEKRQAEIFAYVAGNYRLNVPKTQQYGITQWDVTDHDSWLRRKYKYLDYPLMFDDAYKPKAAYKAFREALQR